jgi:cytochrome P460
MLAPAGLLLGGVLIGQALAQAPPRVLFPPDYKSTLVKYAVVDRSDGVSRDLYASREAIEALKRDPRLRELPPGTLLALDVHSAKVLGQDRKTRAFVYEATRDGHLIRSKDERVLHLMRKIQPGSGSQNWAFGGFDPLTAEPLNLQLPGDCLLCHQAAVVSDMAFSMSLLKRFVETGAVQYSFCAYPGRQSCAF